MMENLLEYEVYSEKVLSDYIYDMQMYQIMNESLLSDGIDQVKEFFLNAYKIFTGFLERKQQIYQLYMKKNHIKKKLKYVERLCKKDKKLARAKIEIRSYGENIDRDDLSTEEEYLITNNVLTIIKTKYKHEDLYKFYQSYVNRISGWDSTRLITLENACVLADSMIEILDADINVLKKELYNFSSYLESNTTESKEEKEKITFSLFDCMMGFCDHIHNQVVYNVEVFLYQFHKVINHELDQMVDEYIAPAKNNKELEKEMKEAKKVKTITYGEDEYNVYELKNMNFDCYNYGGHDIYVYPGFFKLPKGYQLAILYHEIGHHQSKHFMPSDEERKKITVIDEEALIKRIRKDMDTYYYLVCNYGGQFDPRLGGGEELCYLLPELDADRFAAKMVGKSWVKRAMLNSFRESLYVSAKKIVEPAWKKDKKRMKPSDYKYYNMVRQRIRNALM